MCGRPGSPDARGRPGRRPRPPGACCAGRGQGATRGCTAGCLRRRRGRSGPQDGNLFQRLLELSLDANDAHQVLHDFLKFLVDRVRVLALAGGTRPERRQGHLGGFNHIFLSRLGPLLTQSLGILAAYSPARLPNTSRSDKELPPRRLAPCIPPATSPAANRPGTVVAWLSASTSTPPMT